MMSGDHLQGRTQLMLWPLRSEFRSLLSGQHAYLYQMHHTRGESQPSRDGSEIDKGFSDIEGKSCHPDPCGRQQYWNEEIGYTFDWLVYGMP